MPQAFNSPARTDLEARDGSEPQGLRCAIQACWNGKEAGRSRDKPPSLSVALECCVSHGDGCFCEFF